MAEKSLSTIVLVGELFDGFEAYGPFETLEEAASWEESAVPTDIGSVRMVMAHPKIYTCGPDGKAKTLPRVKATIEMGKLLAEAKHRIENLSVDTKTDERLNQIADELKHLRANTTLPEGDELEQIAALMAD